MDDMNRRYSARATNPPILAVPHTNTPSGHSAWGVMFPVILALKLVCAEAALVIPTEPPTAAIVSKGNTAKNFVDDFIRTSPRGRGATIRSLVGRISGLDTTQHGKTNSARFESLGRRLVSTSSRRSQALGIRRPSLRADRRVWGLHFAISYGRLWARSCRQCIVNKRPLTSIGGSKAVGPVSTHYGRWLVKAEWRLPPHWQTLRSAMIWPSFLCSTI